MIALFMGCKETRSVEELRELFDGIFLLDKGAHEPENSLHYIIFYQDSTYTHKYILNGDTLINEGIWKFGKYKDDSYYFKLKRWIPYGNDPFPLEEDEIYDETRSVTPYFGTKKDDYAGLSFHIDLYYDFKKISKQNADRLGIWEDSITWHIEEYDWEWAIRRFEERKKEEEKKKNK